MVLVLVSSNLNISVLSEKDDAQLSLCNEKRNIKTLDSTTFQVTEENIFRFDIHVDEIVVVEVFHCLTMSTK